MGNYPDWLPEAAEQYDISIEEAKRRWDVFQNHVDDPEDPICLGCAQRPHEIDGYILAYMSEMEGHPTKDQVRRWVIHNEGTYNEENGHFMCDACYIINGMPSSPDGWVAP